MALGERRSRESPRESTTGLRSRIPGNFRGGGRGGCGGGGRGSPTQKKGGNKYQGLGYDPGCRSVQGLPRDLRSPSAKFELGLPMIITSLLTKFHQNPASSL